MIDADRRDLQAVFVQRRRRRAVHRDDDGDEIDVLARQHLLAVMRGAVVGVMRIGAVETGNDVLHARRSINLQRRAAACNPCL